jgi:hypothetical protein
LYVAEAEPPPPEGAALVHVVPLLVRTLPLAPGATKVGVLVPLPRMTLLAVSVDSPVPPLATARMLCQTVSKFVLEFLERN